MCLYVGSLNVWISWAWPTRLARPASQDAREFPHAAALDPFRALGRHAVHHDDLHAGGLDVHHALTVAYCIRSW